MSNVPDQPSLFSLPDDDPTECEYPATAPATGYRYGCRCARCRGRSNKPTSTVCKVDGCDAPRRPGQGNCFCEAHYQSNRYVPKGQVYTDVSCLVCGRRRTRRHHKDRPPAPVCEDHQGTGYENVWRALKAHGVDAAAATALLVDGVCHMCGDSVGERLRSRRRKHDFTRVAVDHDHKCCPGQKGCGQCVRGLTHTECNSAAGGLEYFANLIGAAATRRLVERLA